MVDTSKIEVCSNILRAIKSFGTNSRNQISKYVVLYGWSGPYVAPVTAMVDIRVRKLKDSEQLKIYLTLYCYRAFKYY